MFDLASVTTIGKWTWNTDIIAVTGQFAVFNYSGKFYLDSVYISSTVPTNADLLILGDSKTQGFKATYSTRYTTLLSNSF